MKNEPKKVLIVEDNADWRELLSMTVTRLGYKAVLATTGMEGVARASEERPDLILMDIGLPGISGDEATVRIKANPATRDIPVVIQTAYGFDSNAARALEAGAEEIMHKPISITDLQKLMSKYLPS